jgi:hypothetical protein
VRWTDFVNLDGPCPEKDFAARMTTATVFHVLATVALAFLALAWPLVVLGYVMRRFDAVPDRPPRDPFLEPEGDPPCPATSPTSPSRT